MQLFLKLRGIELIKLIKNSIKYFILLINTQ